MDQLFQRYHRVLDKFLLDNTTLAYAFSNETPDIGMLRETAICQMVATLANIEASA